MQARWASALLAVGGLLSAVLAFMPDALYRLIAFPNGIAMIGLGVSLWLATRRSRPPSTPPSTTSTLPLPVERPPPARSRLRICRLQRLDGWLVANLAVDGFAEEVGMAGVTRRLLDQVQQHPAEGEPLPVPQLLDRQLL